MELKYKLNASVILKIIRSFIFSRINYDELHRFY